MLASALDLVKSYGQSKAIWVRIMVMHAYRAYHVYVGAYLPLFQTPQYKTT